MLNNHFVAKKGWCSEERILLAVPVDPSEQVEQRVVPLDIRKIKCRFYEYARVQGIKL
jgi:hypothetical protein